MRTLAGLDAHVQFTHLSKPSCKFLTEAFQPSTNLSLAKASFHTDGVLELMKKCGTSLERVCLLDPKADKELSPEDGDGLFDWFLFGVR